MCTRETEQGITKALTGIKRDKLWPRGPLSPNVLISLDNTDFLIVHKSYIFYFHSGSKIEKIDWHVSGLKIVDGLVFIDYI